MDKEVVYVVAFQGMNGRMLKDRTKENNAMVTTSDITTAKQFRSLQTAELAIREDSLVTKLAAYKPIVRTVTIYRNGKKEMVIV